MKTALILPTNSADYQKVAAFLSTILIFKVAQDQYKTNRKQEDSLDKRGQAELESLKREAEQEILTTKFRQTQGVLHQQMDEDIDLLTRAAGGKHTSSREKQVVKSNPASSQLMVKYKQDDMYMTPVQKLFRSDTDMAYSMFLNLAIGIKEAAYNLSMCFLGGYGAKVNEFLAHLVMAIGVKLGDADTIQLVNSDPDDPLNADAQKLAGKCVTQIKKSAKQIGNKQITYQEAIGYGKVFDQIVKANSEHSFEENLLRSGWVREFAQFVKVVDGNSSSQASSSGFSENSPLMGGQGHHNNADDSCCTIL